jgi:arginase
MLAPAAYGPVATVEVAEPDGFTLPLENGIVARSTLLRQIDSAPDKIVVLGGDCLVDLAPFAYLNERMEAIWPSSGSMPTPM